MLGLKSHIIRTADIQEVSDWYEKVFEQKPYFKEECYIGFDVAWYEFGIFKADVPAAKNHSINIYWGVENIDAEYERVLALGAISLCKPVDVWGDIKMADFEDPFWNFFGIIYNPLNKS